MNEASISAYDKFIIESAEQYLQTVVLIDDRIYENERGSVASRLTKSPVVRRKTALKSATSLSAKSDKKIEKAEAPEESDAVSFHDVQNSFAKKRIICSLYQPEKSASFGEQSDVYKLCSTADVVVIDWDLHGDAGEKATALVCILVEQSMQDIPHQLRLILIYTRDPNLGGVANDIYESLVERGGEQSIGVEDGSEGLILTTDNSRVVILGNTSLPQYSNFLVPESALATRTIREFSRLASGLLQGIVLRGIAKLRENNRRILTRFHKDLDVAFLTHRALLLPDEAFGQIIPLLTDELHAVLEDTLGESPLGKASAVKRIIDDWCDKNWQPGNNAEAFVGENGDAFSFTKDVFCKGRLIKNDYTKHQGGKIPKIVGSIKEKDGHLRWDKDERCLDLANYLLGKCQGDTCNQQLGSLMSQRVKYDNAGRALHLGVIVRDKERYLLCLQPVCDSVRIEGKTRAFVFCVLKEPEKGKRFTHCVIDCGGNMIKLEYKPKVSDVFVSNFKSEIDAICAEKDDSDQFIFKDENGKDYEWIAELKTEHAQQAAEQFGRELSRVGLTESEWLRIKAK